MLSTMDKRVLLAEKLDLNPQIENFNRLVSFLEKRLVFYASVFQ